MQVLVVGAGVVGLAVARAAALKGHEVIVAEQTKGIGNGVFVAQQRSDPRRHVLSDRLVARPSLSAWPRLMVEFCASHGVPHRLCGKLIVATEDAEVGQDRSDLETGRSNGVEGFIMIDGAAARAMEPQLNCVAAAAFAETPASSTAIRSCARCKAIWKTAAARSRSAPRSSG